MRCCVKSMVEKLSKKILPVAQYDAFWNKVQLWQERQHKPKSYLDAYQIKGGTEDPDKHYYVFRWTLPNYAILSAGLKMLMAYEWAEKNKLIPIVDIEYEQVYVNGELGTDNMWEYCFEQPCSLADIHKKKNVIVGPVIHGQEDWKFLRESCMKINGNADDAYIHAVSDIYDSKAYYVLLNKLSVKAWKVQLPILNTTNDLTTNMFQGNKILGLSLRENFNFGEQDKDSFSWKVYKKHPASLPIEEICKLIGEYTTKWNFTHIFVATIYEESVEMLTQKFPGQVLSLNRKRKSILEEKEVAETNWRINAEGNKRQLYEQSIKMSGQEENCERIKDYIQEILLLSKCNYFIGAKCSGTIAACAMNGGQFEDMYIIPDSRNSKKY